MQQPTSGFSISAISIRRHVATLMLTVTAIVLGVFFLTTLQVDLLPAITYPRIGVRLDVPGVSPEVAVDEITRPLEEALSATEGVVQVYSQTREGQVSIDLFFQPGGNIDQALNDATAAFNRGRSGLPDNLNIQEPRLFKTDPSQSPIYEFGLTSPTLKPVELRVFADEQLGRELSVVPGVAAVDVSGGVQEEVRINIDLDRLQAVGVGLTDVLDQLTTRNQDISGGRILGESEPLTRTRGRFQSAQEIRNLSFEAATFEENNSTPGVARRVYLRDFAEVIDGTEDQRVFAFLNKTPAVKVSIQKQPEANTIAVVDGIKRRIESLRQSGLVPADMVITSTLDESVFIQNSISNVTTSGVIGAGLAAIAVLLFLGSLRQTIIIVLAIPLATCAAIILMGLFGLSLNVFSLGGLALGVGIVVDNSIVMLENIVEGVRKDEGDKTNSQFTIDANATLREHNSQLIPNSSPTPDSRTPVALFGDTSARDWLLPTPSIIDRAESSSREVESALVASTSTNLVAVLPFLLIGGFFSLLFRELILTISFAVAASILVAITVVPMMTSRLLGIRRSSGIGKFWLLREFNRRFDAATRSYGNFLNRILRWRLIVVCLAFLVLGGGSVWMAGQIPQEILPRINTGQANLFAQFPPGTALETNRKVMEIVDDILLKQPETDYIFSTAGGFLFGNNTSENPLRASSNITLKPGSNVEAYVARVSQEFDRLNLVGTILRMRPGEVRGLILNNSPVRGAELDVILQGADSEELNRAGQQVLQALEQQAKLASFRPDATPRQPEVQIRPDWERVAEFGLTTQEIGETIQTAIEGAVPTQLQRGDRLVDIRVQLNETAIQRPSQLASLPLFIEGNRQIRLSDVAQIEVGQAPGEVQRIDQRQVFIIAGTLAEGASLGQALAEVNSVMQNVDLPQGVNIIPSSAAQSNQQLQDSLKLLGALAAFLVFVVMAVQYNSLIDPLVIMFTVPLALAGGIFGLYITQTAIGATVLVGAVLLVGIVVNNAILMVELANQIREREACSRWFAIGQAAPQRLRPILMTTITTVLGMLPLAMGIGQGAEFLQPLGIVVFSGLALATFLTLFIIPCFYVMLHDFSWKWATPIWKSVSVLPQKLLDRKHYKDKRW